MVPAILGRGVGLYPCVLNGHALPDTLLLHCKPVKLANLLALCFRFTKLEPLRCGQTPGVDQTKRLARGSHAVVLPFEVELMLGPLLCLVKLPCAVNRPVAERAVAIGKPC
jgi:hypothetical protein